MMLSHKIRLVPTDRQIDYFRRACGTTRFTYNWALAEWKQQYEAGEKPSGHRLKKRFNEIRAQEYPWTYEVHRDCTAGAFSAVQSAFKHFFRRVKEKQRPGYPKFKKKGRCKDSFPIANDKFALDGKRIRIPKLGWVNMRESLRFEGKIMSAVVSRTADYWFVAIAVGTKVDSTSPKTKETVGVDLGITALATLSNGKKYQHSKRWKRLERQVRRLQKRVSKKEKGSANRAKAVTRLARKHYKLACLRADTLHKITTELVEAYPTIVVEDLNVKGMLKNHNLACAISRQGWGEFFRQLGYKTQMRDRQLIVAGRFYPSSKTCSDCGAIAPKLPLSIREWVCSACGVIHDRDINAAINLSNLPVGYGKVKPVETEALVRSRCVSDETAVCEAGTEPG